MLQYFNKQIHSPYLTYYTGKKHLLFLYTNLITPKISDFAEEQIFEDF